MKTCDKCGEQISDENSFCTSCGCKAVSYKVVPINAHAILNAVGYFVLGIAIALGSIWIRRFGFSFWWILNIFAFMCFLYTIKTFMTVGKKAYIVNCPVCNQEFLFPFGELGVACPKCDKRIIMVDGKAETADKINITKGGDVK